MSYNYHKQEGNHRVIITLHGTGADEHDLDALAQAIDPEATLYGLRGDVNENGMLRWFRRSAPGVYDEQDLHMRARALDVWLQEFAENEGINLQEALFMGFSNGANMIAALMKLYPSTIQRAAILHGHDPLPDETYPAFSKANVFVSAGVKDHMITYQQTRELVHGLKETQAHVEFFSHPMGHMITPDEVSALREFWHELTPL